MNTILPFLCPNTLCGLMDRSYSLGTIRRSRFDMPITKFLKIRFFEIFKVKMILTKNSFSFQKKSDSSGRLSGEGSSTLTHSV